MDEFFNRHFIKTDEMGRVIDAWSDGPFPNKDTSDAILVTEKGGYQFRFYPGGEENPIIYTEDGIPLYRWDGRKIVQRTVAEITSEQDNLPEPAPTEMEKMRADIDFLLAMEGV